MNTPIRNLLLVTAKFFEVNVLCMSLMHLGPSGIQRAKNIPLWDITWSQMVINYANEHEIIISNWASQGGGVLGGIANLICDP